MPVDFDGPWKEALHNVFEPFLAFAFPDIHARLDWQAEHTALDQELQKLLPESSGGVRRVDKLVQAHREGSGDPRFLHVEAQMHRDDDFPHRMFVYSYRGRDRFGQPLLSLAVLGDDNPRWHPTSHQEGELGCETLFRFRTIKLLDWKDRLEELERSDNPFSLFVLAHLQALATAEGDPDRQQWKLRILDNLAGRNLKEWDCGVWYRLIDWILPLSPEGEKQLWLTISSRAKENQMSYVTYAERFYTEKAEKAGFDKGEKAGFDKGEKAGFDKGEKTGMLQAVKVLLQAKFGSEGASLGEQLDPAMDSAVVASLVAFVGTAGSLDDVRTFLAEQRPPGQR